MGIAKKRRWAMIDSSAKTSMRRTLITMSNEPSFTLATLGRGA
jgi:hypothetical protein